MKSTNQFQTYEVPWEEFIEALRGNEEASRGRYY